MYKTLHVLLLSLILCTAEASSQSVQMCDVLDDSTWQGRWTVSLGAPILVNSPICGGSGALESHGTCVSAIYLTGFAAKEGEYGVCADQEHHQAGFDIRIQVQPGANPNPDYRIGYKFRLHAANAQPPGVFVLERTSEDGSSYALGSKTPTFLKGEWIQVFLRRYAGNLFIAGYQRPNGFRDSIIVSDPNPPIDQPGAFYLTACSDVAPFTYFDNACFKSDKSYMSVCGDASCDGTVNISDAVYLIQYIFAGGAAPCASCAK